MQRGVEFRHLLAAAMAKKGLGEEELARAIDAHRSTVSRWLSGTIPRKRFILQLKTPLGLEDADLVALIQSAYPEYSAAMKPVTPVAGDYPMRATGTLYFYRYSPSNFPSLWSKRQYEWERNLRGPIRTMFTTLPAVVRPFELYNFYAEEGLFDAAKVAAYTEEIRQRQADFRERIKEFSVKHVYSMDAVAHLLGSGHWRQFDRLPASLIERQVQVIEELLEYSNFQVGLWRHWIPLHMTVIAHRVVLVEMLHFAQPSPLANLFGWETDEAEIVLALGEQFDALWDHKDMLKDQGEIRKWFAGGWKDYLRSHYSQLIESIAQ